MNVIFSMMKNKTEYINPPTRKLKVWYNKNKNYTLKLRHWRQCLYVMILKDCLIGGNDGVYNQYKPFLWKKGYLLSSNCFSIKFNIEHFCFKYKNSPFVNIIINYFISVISFVI